MRYLTIVFVFTFSEITFSQNFSIEEELQLANHLINTNNNTEAIHHLKNTLNRFSPEQAYTDTLNFLLGYAYYQQKKLLLSNKYFLKVTDKSNSYQQARFTSIYNCLYNRQYSGARDLLNKLDAGNSLHSEYKAMQKAGLSLLTGNYNDYPESSKEFSYKYFPIEKEQNELDTYYKDLINFKPKSMAVAGLLSAVLPGTGKMYGGKLGEGMTALFIVTILGAITTENYLKNGLDNYKTIAFGSLFSIFYLGNIYGSMVSVKVYREEFYKTYERKILLNVHIPLRNIFY